MGGAEGRGAAAGSAEAAVAVGAVGWRAVAVGMRAVVAMAGTVVVALAAGVAGAAVGAAGDASVALHRAVAPGWDRCRRL